MHKNTPAGRSGAGDTRLCPRRGRSASGGKIEADHTTDREPWQQRLQTLLIQIKAKRFFNAVKSTDRPSLAR